MVGAARRKELAAGLPGVFATSTREAALRLASEMAEKRREKGHSKVADHLEEHIEEYLSCLAFLESHWRGIRTTNDLERFNQERKRRAGVVRIFPNREACLHLVTALAVEQSEEWVTGRRYLGVRKLEESRREERGMEEVVSMER